MTDLSGMNAAERKAYYLSSICQDLLTETKGKTDPQNIYYSFKEVGEADRVGLPSDKHKQLALLLDLEAIGAVKVFMPTRDYKKTDNGTSLQRILLKANVIKLKELADKQVQAPTKNTEASAQPAAATNFSINQGDGILYYRKSPIIRTHQSHGGSDAGRRKILIRLWDARAIELNGVRVHEGIPQTREALRRVAAYPNKNSVDAAIKFFNRQLIAASVPAQVKSRDNKGQILTLLE